MRVLHVIDSGGVYGAEVMLLGLMREQRVQGVEPVLCSIGEPGIGDKPLELRAEQGGFQVLRLRMRKGLNLRGALAIARLGREERCDLFHTHGYKGNILLACLPRRLRRLPMIATLHGWTGISGYNKLAVYQWLDARMLRRADAVILVNKAIAQHPLFNHVRAKQMYVVENGIPLLQHQAECFEPDPHISAFCKDGFVIGSIGRLSPEKGYNDLIEALAILRARGLPAKLIIIGEGEHSAHLMREIEQRNLNEYVLLPGYKANAARYLTLFNVFVLSSLSEGLPITLLEAMAQHIPVVATRVGGIPDVLTDKETGMLVSSQQPKALADAIAALQQDCAFAHALSQRAHRTVTNQYTSSRMAQKYLEIYDALTKRANN